VGFWAKIQGLSGNRKYFGGLSGEQQTLWWPEDMVTAKCHSDKRLSTIGLYMPSN
jgi:hypothetical protein